MITEDYVSFEIAKLLKEKGFDSDDVGCHGGFYSERCYESGHGIKTQSGQEVGIVYDDLTNSDLDYDQYLRPTLQMAMKWLREEHKIFIAQEFGWFHGDYEYQVSVIKMNLTIPPALDSVHYIKDLRHKTCEGACEKAIKYCLTHLI